MYSGHLVQIFRLRKMLMYYFVHSAFSILKSYYMTRYTSFNYSGLLEPFYAVSKNSRTFLYAKIFFAARNNSTSLAMQVLIKVF